VVRNADNPPGLVSGILKRFCSLSRFLLSMTCSVDFLLFALVLNGLLGLMELAAVPEEVDGLVGSGRPISAIGLEGT